MFKINNKKDFNKPFSVNPCFSGEEILALLFLVQEQLLDYQAQQAAVYMEILMPENRRKIYPNVLQLRTVLNKRFLNIYKDNFN